MDYLVNWLEITVKNIGRNRTITLTIEDGFTIHGNFHLGILCKKN